MMNKSYSFYGNIFDDIEDYAFIVLDKGGNVAEWNKGAQLIKGYKPEEIIGKHFSIFYSEKDQEQGLPAQMLAQAIEFGKASTEGWRIKKDGSSFWGTILIKTLKNDAGEVTGFTKITRDLTQQKLAEEKLKLSESNLKAIFNRSSEALIETDTDGIILAFNDQAVQMNILNGQNKYRIGGNISDFISEERKETHLIYFRKALAGEASRFERFFPAGSGTGSWFDFTIYPLKDGNEIKGVCFSGVDITERKLATLQLEKNERYFRALVENNFDGIVLHDENGMIFYQSPAAERISGYTLEEKQRPSWIDIFHPEDAEVVRNRIETARKNPGVPISSVNRLRHKSGKYIWTEGTTTNLLGDENVRAMVSDFRDISDRKRAEEIMDRSERKYRALVENNFEAIVLLNDQGIVTYASPGTEKIMGLSSSEIVGKDGSTFFHPDEMDAATKNPGKPIFTRNRIRRRDGQYIWTEGTTTNFLDDENVKSFVGNFRDITERKLAEEKIQHANRMYLFVSSINQAIVHVSDQQTLFDTVCQVAAEIGGFDFAWIGLPDTENKKLNLVAHAKASEDDLAQIRDFVYDMNGPTAHVMRTGSCYIINDYIKDAANIKPRAYADARGFRSSISLPITKFGDTIGTFNLLSQLPGLFDEDELRLLLEVAGDISFALEVFEKERLRAKAEQQLKHSELRLLQAQVIAHIGSWEEDLTTGFEIWSPEACRIYGLPEQDNKQTFGSWISFIHPDDIDHVMKIVIDSKVKLCDTAFYHRIIRTDGTVRYVYSQSHFEFDDEGVPVSKYGIVHDVTDQKLAEEKIIHTKRLYEFISGINQIIVHVTDQTSVFKEVCRLAVYVGEFKMAWIGMGNEERNEISLVEGCGIQAVDIELFQHVPFDNEGPQHRALAKGDYYVCNDIPNDLETINWKPFAEKYGINSCIVLPVRKMGSVIGTMNLYSTKLNLFDAGEIKLLKEASDDISFAIDLFEKENARQQMETRLLRSETRLKQAQAISHIGSWELYFSTGKAYWSEENCRIFGLPPEENVQTFESFLSFVHPDDLKYVIDITQRSRETLESVAFHHRIILRDGTLKYVYTVSHIEFNSDGVAVGFYGVSHDETGIKESELSLAQSEANLRMIIDLIPQAIFAKDFDGNFLFINSNFASLYGLTPDEMINKNIREIIPVKDEANFFLETDRQVIATGMTRIIPESSFTDHNGDRRVLHSVKVPFTVAGTNEKAVLAVLFDITEQKRAEAERNKILSDIVQRNKDLEQFSYIISHNLRSPVANIMGIMDVKKYQGISKEDENYLDAELFNSVKKLDDVITDLNQVLQVKNEISGKRELVKFSDLLNDARHSIERLAVNEGTIINCDFAAINEMSTLKSYLYSVFYNLLSNSIKYRQPGKTPVIEVHSYITAANKIGLSFKDNGLGIDLARRKDQIFGLYKRFHFHTEGKGIGLFMVKTQVETLGGTISVISEVNKGTEFRIEFDVS